MVASSKITMREVIKLPLVFRHGGILLTWTGCLYGFLDQGVSTFIDLESLHFIDLEVSIYIRGSLYTLYTWRSLHFIDLERFSRRRGRLYSLQTWRSLQRGGGPFLVHRYGTGLTQMCRLWTSTSTASSAQGYVGFDGRKVSDSPQHSASGMGYNIHLFVCFRPYFT